MPRLESIAATLHPIAARAFAVAVRTAANRPNVASVSRELGCSPRQIQRRFAMAHLPPPQRLIVVSRWLAVLTAGLYDGMRTRQLADVLHFPSSQSLCRAVKRELGVSLGVARRVEVVERIVGALQLEYADTTVVILRYRWIYSKTLMILTSAQVNRALSTAS